MFIGYHSSGHFGEANKKHKLNIHSVLKRPSYSLLSISIPSLASGVIDTVPSSHISPCLK